MNKINLNKGCMILSPLISSLGYDSLMIGFKYLIFDKALITLGAFIFCNSLLTIIGKILFNFF